MLLLEASHCPRPRAATPLRSRRQVGAVPPASIADAGSGPGQFARNGVIRCFSRIRSPERPAAPQTGPDVASGPRGPPAARERAAAPDPSRSSPSRPLSGESSVHRVQEVRAEWRTLALPMSRPTCGIRLQVRSCQVEGSLGLPHSAPMLVAQGTVVASLAKPIPDLECADTPMPFSGRPRLVRLELRKGSTRSEMIPFSRNGSGRPASSSSVSSQRLIECPTVAPQEISPGFHVGADHSFSVDVALELDDTFGPRRRRGPTIRIALPLALRVIPTSSDHQRELVGARPRTLPWISERSDGLHPSFSEGVSASPEQPPVFVPW